MHSGQSQFVENAGKCRIVGHTMSTVLRAFECRGGGNHPGSQQAGFRCQGDSILRDFYAPFIPNYMGRRQTEIATLRGTKIPCPQRLYNKKHFFFWNQSVAAELKGGPRLLKFVHGSPEFGGGAMATLHDFCASLLYGVLSENSSDSRCRLHG